MVSPVPPFHFAPACIDSPGAAFDAADPDLPRYSVVAAHLLAARSDLPTPDRVQTFIRDRMDGPPVRAGDFHSAPDLLLPDPRGAQLLVARVTNAAAGTVVPVALRGGVHLHAFQAFARGEVTAVTTGTVPGEVSVTDIPDAVRAEMFCMNAYVTTRALSLAEYRYLVRLIEALDAVHATCPQPS